MFFRRILSYSLSPSNDYLNFRYEYKIFSKINSKSHLKNFHKTADQIIVINKSHSTEGRSELLNALKLKSITHLHRNNKLLISLGYNEYCLQVIINFQLR